MQATCVAVGPSHIFKVFIPINSLSRIQNMPCKYCRSALYAYARCSYCTIMCMCIVYVAPLCIVYVAPPLVVLPFLYSYMEAHAALPNMEVYIKIQNLDSNSN